ncbi:MAG: hemerythrin domain-containing protein [Holophagaceae bacterium]|nr:hemerythrin domain-containing protein [Holophagaceae bacterium]
MEGPEFITLTFRLAADHREIDRLFRDAMAAMGRSHRLDAHALLDRIWMRLAVHIRAEHKAVFPVLAEARPDLGIHLQTLREDHDFFMASLAGAVKVMQDPLPDFASTREGVEAVRLRLISHNALEEELIYPAVDQLSHEQQVRVIGDVSRELTFLPKRYGP